MMNTQLISFENSQLAINGVLTFPTQIDSPPLVILCHGFTGDCNESLVATTDKGMFQLTAEQFANAGIATLRCDFSGSGESKGDWFNTTITTELNDLAFILSQLDELPISFTKVGLLGLSLGGLISAITASSNENIDSLVLWNPVSNPYATFSQIFTPEAVHQAVSGKTDQVALPARWGTKYGPLSSEFFFDLYEYDPIAAIGSYTQPLMVIVGTEDDVVLQPQSSNLYIKYHQYQQAFVTLNADHSFDTSKSIIKLNQAIESSLEWFKKTLK
ncbi:alpha/beta hydrolase [Vibrio sp. SS-MA-C1-2]|uniref:alpha/beta hydrolase family protein n=1 Tax=Vibrio sp. SS-MA-C1-2 TaxID=2908646 RepID=UPI001F2DA7F2|nr:alpha/beta hydrolase [Vibrio sp. SS-MA-C1-2]UJF16976.1 alpha/beta hydrolase [Vibrio sp. SS-MA-C1-2]